MRQLITGLVAAVAVMAAAPAMACGFNPCGWQPQVYVAPVVTYDTGCNPCGGGYGGGWTHERLADPVTQYYYVNQGPTYTGPGAWAPEPVYQDTSVSYGRPYGYRRHYGHMGYHHGYGGRHAYAPMNYGHRPLRRYY